MSSLSSWIIEGTAQKATHLIMVMDHFDYDTYPVYVLPTDNVLDVITEYQFKSMQRIVGVYELSDSKAINVTKSYRTAPASPEQIAIKKERERIWKAFNDLGYWPTKYSEVFDCIFEEEK